MQAEGTNGVPQEARAFPNDIKLFRAVGKTAECNKLLLNGWAMKAGMKSALINVAQRTGGTTPAMRCMVQGRRSCVNARGTHQLGAQPERIGPCTSQGDQAEASMSGTITAPQSLVKEDDRTAGTGFG